MELKLTVYKDDCLTEVDRTEVADKLKIPYRVSMYIIKSLDHVNLDNESDLMGFITSNVEYMDKILKATFNLSDHDLECIDTSDLLDTIVALYKWGIEKINSINGGGSKN